MDLAARRKRDPGKVDIAVRLGKEPTLPVKQISAGLLNDAQLVVAREYGFSNWTELKERISANSAVRLLQGVIHQDDREAVVRLWRANPNLLHVPLSFRNAAVLAQPHEIRIMGRRVVVCVVIQ